MTTSKRKAADGGAQIVADGILYEGLTYAIRGACFRLHSILGSRLNEKAYGNALAIELGKLKLPFEREKTLPILYEGKQIGRFVADFVIDRSVLLELKAKPFIGDAERDQFWKYLRQSDYRVGLLINFGSSRVHIERRVFDLARQDPPQSAETSA